MWRLHCAILFSNRKLTEEEKERRLQEMMDNVKWREEQRTKNVKHYADQDRKEELEMKSGKGAEFLKYMYFLCVKASVQWHNCKKSQKSCVCFQHSKHDQTLYLIWYASQSNFVIYDFCIKVTFHQSLLAKSVEDLTTPGCGFESQYRGKFSFCIFFAYHVLPTGRLSPANEIKHDFHPR